MHIDDRSARPTAPPGRPASFSSPALFGWVLLGLTFSLSCRPGGPNPLQRMAPGLEPALAEHLFEDDPEAFRRYALAIGPAGLVHARMVLLAAPPDQVPAFVEHETTLAPYVGRVVTVMAEDLGLSFLRRALDAYRGRPLPDRMAAASIIRRHLSILDDPALDPASKVSRYESLIDEARPFQSVLNVGDLYSGYVELLPRLNRRAEMPAALGRGIEHALAFGDTNLACQFLGMLGVCHAQDRDDAGMRASWDRALELVRNRRSWQEARILSLYSTYYKSIGDPGRALELLARAEACSRELGRDDFEIRFLSDSVRMYADMSCWDLVERGLARAEVLIRRGEARWPAVERDAYKAAARILRMRLAAAIGPAPEAARLARQVIREANAMPAAPRRETAVYEACRVLADVGHPTEAAAELAASMDRCRAQGMPEVLQRQLIASAAIHLQTGDTTGCRLAMEEFRAFGPRDSTDLRYWLTHDLLEARLVHRTSGRQAATRALAEGIEYLERRRTAIAASPEAQLLHRVTDDFLSFFHDMYPDPPELGYLLEMCWPGLVDPGVEPPAGRAPSRIVRMATEGAPPQLPPLPGDDIHCVYRWDADRLVRWTRSGTAITREVLPVKARDFERRLARVEASLSRPRGNRRMLDARTIRDLRDLARTLLPAEVLGAGDHRRLMLTRNGPLAGVPFEALNVAERGYEPLLSRHDIVYVRGFGADDRHADPAASPGRTLIVTNPRYDAAMHRKWSILGEPLGAGKAEALRVAALAPDAVVLAESLASHEELLARWEGAERIYLMGHFVTDPDRSYDTLFPLAPGRDGPDRLGLRDVRQAHLARCRLAVLSGCATGVRYRSGTTELPSLGEEFVEAGARHVIATGWTVRDDEGARLMHRFNDRDSADPADPVATLCDVRREAIRRGEHPNTWAAYLILGSVPWIDDPTPPPPPSPGS